MEFLKFVRLDILAAVIFLFIVITSAMKNQKKVWRNLICFIFAILLVGIPMFFDVGGLFSQAAKYLNVNIFPKLNNVFKVEDTATFFPVLGILTTIIIVLLITLLFCGICALIGGSDRKKYAKYPSYASLHKPVSGVIAGIIKGFLVVYTLFVFWMILSNFTGIDTTNDFVVKLLTKIDGIVKTFLNILTSGIGG